MTLVRTAAATAAVATLMLLPLPVAHAQTAPVRVAPDGLNGWVINPDPATPAPPFAFVADPGAPLGTGSLQLGPISATPASKMIVQRAESFPSETFAGLSVDYLIAPGATNKDPQQYYVNIHAKVAGSTTGFFDCSYDYIAAEGGDGWHTLAVAGDTAADSVRSRAAGSPAACGTSPAGLVGGTVLRIVLNAGDTSANDAGIAGGFDRVVVAEGGSSTVYDFEPAVRTACDDALAPGRTGTARNDYLVGTAAGERLDGVDGNDVVDARDGDDCVLGGTGQDYLRTGAGADEILGGDGNDTIDAGDGADLVDPGAGRDSVSAGTGDDHLSLADGEVDSVDCGAGTDTVVADAGDLLRNCEVRTA